MATEDIQYIIFFAFLLALVPFIFFFISQQRLLQAIRPENRLLPPANVWLQLIPLFGAVYQFIVIRKIADSITNELTDTDPDSILSEKEIIPPNPTYRNGVIYCICFCFSILPIPFIKTAIAFVGLGFWIAYWTEISRYRQKINNRG